MHVHLSYGKKTFKGELAPIFWGEAELFLGIWGAKAKYC